MAASGFCVSFLLALYLSPLHTIAQTLSAPGQPTRSGALNSFELVGDSLVSAQQVYPQILSRVT